MEQQFKITHSGCEDWSAGKVLLHKNKNLCMHPQKPPEVNAYHSCLEWQLPCDATEERKRDTVKDHGPASLATETINTTSCVKQIRRQ